MNAQLDIILQPIPITELPLTILLIKMIKE